MIPGAQHNIVAVKTVFFFHMTVHPLWPVDIFLVVITTHMQLWYLCILYIVKRRIFLPEIIVVGMLYKIVPGRNFVVEIFIIYIFKRSQLQVPVKQIKLRKWKIAI